VFDFIPRERHGRALCNGGETKHKRDAPGRLQLSSAATAGKRSAQHVPPEAGSARACRRAPLHDTLCEHREPFHAGGARLAIR
jgi:hypothetical protein